ncbi:MULTISPECIES: hypothetical protein [unclassified Pseudoalteromonas]|uniref:hypothetical protein n=1 Tax=unclassified Pseudoalteromonas TaxID=194690 RepID=UPI00160237BA|nr:MULTISPECIES: hypothetical protein [unclassified Pseudoalteromonas]MBB1332163.1 hypothetical protein [Pseudoalteromonas sp. SR41-6]MBB1457421.1 hypothetical protein [Pseudoalteromonas sp. SG41-8]
MMAHVLRLCLFILFTFSFNSFAKYSEAMCILYKQQMQQYSDNTSSRSYRNAAKDYKNNCSNPPPAASQAQPAPVVIAPKTHVDNKIKSTLETQNSTVNPLDSNSSVAKNEPAEVQREASVIVENVENVQSIEVEQKSSAETTVEQPLGQNNDVVDATPEAVIISEPATIKVTAPEPVRTESDSLLMPSLLLLVVLLLAAMLLLRLRANKKAAVETAPLIPATDKASSTEAAESKPTPAKAEPIASESTVAPKKAVIAEQVAIATPQTEVISADDVNVKVELTQRLFKNEHDFKEPEVRMFDPDAPLPGQKPQQPKNVIKPATINVKADLDTNLEPHQTTTTELDSEAEQLPKMDDENVIHCATNEVANEIVHSDAVNSSGQVLTSGLSQMREVKLSTTVDVQPQADTLTVTDSDDEIAQALAALNDELAAEQHSASEHDERDDISGAFVADPNQSKANPFANLSLDPTWDPNSKEKPTIVPKKTVPKSAKLIAAQERAKQLKTDD